MLVDINVMETYLNMLQVYNNHRSTMIVNHHLGGEYQWLLVGWDVSNSILTLAFRRIANAIVSERINVLKGGLLRLISYKKVAFKMLLK